MLDFADCVAINKFDRKGADDALRDVRKQFQSVTGQAFEKDLSMPRCLYLARSHHNFQRSTVSPLLYQRVVIAIIEVFGLADTRRR